MNAPRSHTSARPSAVPVHRGPQAVAPTPAPSPLGPQYHHAPNAALLIDFDNVTMGIRSDLQSELRALLSSDIIKGKVAVQRAYADWRRYPQYIVPLAESSIDLIFAPAYGSSKKNATDIRLAIDALELVFTRPEIGTYILLSGDSDFSSLVLKLKEYGKYVIGVGIRESSSDLLVQNCDEYYSYNALTGLVKTSDDEAVKYDPWELVVEAVTRMKRNGDVMRADRRKQVMQDIDQSCDEKNLGMAKFSRFVQEAAQRGLLRLSRLENGQIEVGVVERAADEVSPAPAAAGEEVRDRQGGAPRPDVARTEENGRRGRRGGRGRERGERREREARPVEGGLAQQPTSPPPVPAPAAAPPAAAAAVDAEMTGQRVTRDEAFDVVRRAVAELTRSGAGAALASAVRRKARELLGRDSESLNERPFDRILRDAHDADVIDLRKHGDDYEVSPAAVAEPIAAQLLTTPTAEPSQAARSAANAAALRRGIRFRGVGRGGRAEAPPPELLSVGVVDAQLEPATPALTPATPEPPIIESESAPEAAAEPAPSGDQPAPRRGRRGGRAPAAKSRGRKAAAGGTPEAADQPGSVAPEGDTEAVVTPDTLAAEAAPADAPMGDQPAAERPRRTRSRRKSTAPAGGEG